MSIELKERWSKLKYWQRGGMAATVIGTVLFYLLFWNMSVSDPDKMGTISFLISTFLFSPIFFSGLIGEVLLTDNIFIVYLLSIVLYFIIGASIAHVIYEIKNSVSSSGISKWYSRIIALTILAFYILITFIIFILSYLFSGF